MAFFASVYITEEMSVIPLPATTDYPQIFRKWRGLVSPCLTKNLHLPIVPQGKWGLVGQLSLVLPRCYASNYQGREIKSVATACVLKTAFYLSGFLPSVKLCALGGIAILMSSFRDAHVDMYVSWWHYSVL